MARVPERHDELRRARSIGFAGIPGGASGRYAPAVTAGDTLLPDMEVARDLASALRAGDDSAAAGLVARVGVPRWLLTHRSSARAGDWIPAMPGRRWGASRR